MFRNGDAFYLRVHCLRRSLELESGSSFGDGVGEDAQAKVVNELLVLVKPGGSATILGGPQSSLEPSVQGFGDIAVPVDCEEGFLVGT